MIDPSISIVIPCYNHGLYVIETLESVLNQSYKNFECIIIDDGSTDNTKNIVLNWIESDKRFKYFFQENSGLSAARNKGITLSIGKYILPLDSDDKISDNYVECCITVLDKNYNIKIAYGQGFVFGKSNKKWNLDNFLYDDLLYKNMIHCSGVFRKEDWLRVGGYDEYLKEGLEDWEFWIHILKGGGDVVKLVNCSFFYRIKESSMITDNVINNNYGYKSRLYIFEKHIEQYCKTNFYDMYFENYKLKKMTANPLIFLSIKNIVLLLLKSILLINKNFIKRVIRKVKSLKLKLLS